MARITSQGSNDSCIRFGRIARVSSLACMVSMLSACTATIQMTEMRRIDATVDRVDDEALYVELDTRWERPRKAAKLLGIEVDALPQENAPELRREETLGGPEFHLWRSPLDTKWHLGPVDPTATVIPRGDVVDIDHPGNVIGIIGASVLLLGVIGLMGAITELETATEEGTAILGVVLVSGLLVAPGVVMTTAGWIMYGSSVSRSGDLATTDTPWGGRLAFRW